MKIITLHLPKAYIEGLDYLVKAKVYPNRSELIRNAIRDLLKAELGFLRPSLELQKVSAKINYF